MKKCKKPSAIAAGIPGMANGGQATPEMLGWGMARGAGRHLANRGPQLARAEAEAMGAAPAAPAAPAAVAGPGGGLSKIRDGAVPPAHMLAAQRRGMADGGMPLPAGYQRFYETDGMARGRLAETAQRNFDAAGGSVPASNDVDTMGRPVVKKRTMYGYRGYDASREPMLDAVAGKRQNTGLPSAQAIRSGITAKIAKNQGMKDGGMKRGNAAEIETGDGGAVRGPGGPTDDRVGPVALANTEYVLPADTVEAMGGAQALDKIRAATHKFVDPANKPSIAKGLANGGYAVNEIPVEEISMGRSRADRAAIDEAVKRGQRPPGMAKNPANTPALDRISSKMQASNMTKAPSSRTASIAKGLGATGLAMGAYDSLSDLENGYRDRSQEALGVETPVGSVAADAFRTMNNVGNAVTFGLAGKVGRGIASMTDGNGFMEGFASPSDRDQFLAQREGAQAAALPEAGQQQPAAAQATAPTAPQAGSDATAAQVKPTIGKINVTRQPNGVMSFSGKDKVDGYEGQAAGELRGGGYSGAVSPADYQAAVARAEADKAAAAKLDEPRGNAIAMRLPQTFGEAMQYRAAMAMNRLNQRANESDSREQTDRMRIAAGMPYEQERTRGTKLANDQSALLSQMVNTYLNAPDEATRTDALTKLNALNGKNGGADKYITVDMESGVDALGNPIIRKVPFNTRTGQIVDVSGQGGGGGVAKGGYPDGTRLNGPDGRAYIVKNGEPVPVQ